MTRLTLIRSMCLLCILSSSLMSSTARAQSGLSRFDRPFSRPTISPYVNLLRGQGNGGGANVGLNYFGIVRPQQQFGERNQQLTQQLQTVNRRSQSRGIQSRTQGRQFRQYRVGSTGHAASFLSIGGGVAGAGGQAVGQNLQLSGFTNAGGLGGTTGNSPGFGGGGGGGGSSFSGSGGGFGGGFSGGFGGGDSFGGGGFGGGSSFGGGGFGGGGFGGGSSFGGSSFGSGLGQGF
ncbi:MAG: hypothetical protein ABJZ55_06245 [Fuerstiella sp.]